MIEAPEKTGGSFDIFVPGLLALFSALYLISYWSYGPNLSDDGVFIEAALDILNGGRYNDTFLSFYGAVMIYSLALFFKLLGISFFAYRIWGITFHVISVPLFYFLSRRFLSKKVTLITTLIFILLPGHIHKSFFTLGVIGYTTFIVFCINMDKRKFAIYAGFFTNLLLFLRPDLGAFAVCLTCSAIFVQYLRKREGINQLKTALSYMLILIAFFFLFAILFGPGVLAYYSVIARVFVTGFVAKVHLPYPISFIRESVAETWPTFYSFLCDFLLLLLIAGAFLNLRGIKQRWSSDIEGDFILFYIATFGIFFMVIWWRPNLGHVVKAAPLFYILAAILFNRIKLSSGKLKTISYLTSLLLGVIYIYYMLIITTNFSTGSITQIKTMKGVINSQRGKIHFYKEHVGEINNLIEYIMNNQKPNETVVILQNEVSLYFLLNKPNRTRLPVVTPGIFFLCGEQWRPHLNDAIKDPLTRHAIYYEPSLYHQIPRPKKFRFMYALPQTFDIVMANFKFDKMIGRYMVLEKTSEPEPATRHYLIGYEELQYGNYGEALKEFNKARSLGMDNKDLNSFTGKTKKMLGL